MKKAIAILQSSYLPWKGYFDIINTVDEFVLYDIVQYSKNDFRNRNRVIVNGKPTWITIPVHQKALDQRIDETQIAYAKWATKHWRTIEQSYGKAPGFAVFGPAIRDLFRRCADEVSLSAVNATMIRGLAGLMGITTPISSAADLVLPTDRIERIVSICEQLGAGRYLSGPAAKAYMSENDLAQHGIEVEWVDYSGYTPYSQATEEFEHGVSVIDLLFQEGSEFGRFMKSFG